MTDDVVVAPGVDRPRIAGRAWQVWASTVARLVLAGVLGVAGLLKIGNPDEAAAAVQAYRLLPPRLGEVVGYGLPFLEIALAVLLLLGIATRFAAVATGVLMVVFIGGIISVWARGLSIDCGCFGGGGEVTDAETKYAQEIARDLLFLGLACWLAIFPASRLALGRRRPIDDDEEAP